MLEHLNEIRKYNLWDNNNINPGITRHIYTDQIFRYTDNGIIKVLSGQRRVGKSYILRQIAMKLLDSGVPAANILIINKEFAAYDFIDSHEALHRLIQTYKQALGVTGRYYLLIDEVQDISDWEKTINSYSQDYTEETDIFITGSNSKLLSGELSTKISGRYIRFEIFTLTFDEYISFYGGRYDRATYMEYLRTGGLPALTKLPDNEMKANYVSSLRDTILLKDVVAHYNIKDVRLLEDLFSYLVSSASSLVSIPNIVNYIKSRGCNASYTTVSSYIEYMQEAYLLHRAERYNIKGKEIISGSCKYYANDVAYKNYLYPHYGSGVGYMLENLVYLQLAQAEYTVQTGTLQGKEIDFVARKGDREIFIQVAYALDEPSTLQREYSPLMQLLPAYEKWIVSLDEYVPNLPAGIKNVPAWELGGELRKRD